MIRITDATVLALTKLRARRIRTLVTIIVSGLLFASLIAVLIIAQGTNDSIHAFSKEGLNSRYIVQALTDPPLTMNTMESPDIKARAQQIYKQTLARKKAEAKKLGIGYDASTEPQPLNSLEGIPSQQAKTILNLQSSAAQQALAEYFQAHPGPGLEDLQKIADPYKPAGFYTITAGGTNGTLSTMQAGKENFSTNEQINNDSQKDILQSSAIEAVAPQLTDPFLLPNQPKHYHANDIPVVLSYSKAAQLLGLASLPKSAMPAQQLSRIKTLYAKAGTLTFTACYRNSISEQQIQTAISQAANRIRNSGNKDYQKPDLVYGLPAATSCGPAVIKSDTRSQAEKALTAKQNDFTKKFDGTVDPSQHKLTFRVVGLTPDPNASASTTIGGLLQGIVGSTLDGAIAIPSNMLDKLPDAPLVKSILFSSKTDSLGFPATSYYVEFSTASAARNFINDKSCTTRSDGRCAVATKPFQLNAYGSNSIALQDLQHRFFHFFELGALVIVVIAIVIMTGTVGRMLADSRRETAVFRAIGAKRLDIVSIYGLYTLCLSTYVALFSLLAGVTLAYAFDQHFWQSTTVQAQLLFGASDTSRQFHLFAINVPLIGLVLLVAVVCGLVSMVLPLLRNIRRNPNKDMREE